MSDLVIIDRSKRPTMPPGQRADSTKVYARAELRPETLDEEDSSVEVVFSTGASVLRFDDCSWDFFNESLDITEAAIRTTRLANGVSVLDTHWSYSADNVLGRTIPGSFRIEDGKAIVRCKLTKAAVNADTILKIREGILTDISVGYVVHTYVKTEVEGRIAEWRATDWEPLEVSFVPVPADPGCQARAADFHLARAEQNQEHIEVADNTNPTPPAPQATEEQIRAAVQASERANNARRLEIRRAGEAFNAPADLIARALDGVEANGTTAAADPMTVEQFYRAVTDHRASEQVRDLGERAPRQPARTMNERNPEQLIQLRGAALSATINNVRRIEDAEVRDFMNEQGGHYGFHAMAEDCLVGLGQSVRGMDGRQMVQACMRSGFGLHTSSDFALITQASAEVTLRDTYLRLEGETNYGEWTDSSIVPNLNEVTTGVLGSYSSMEPIPENGRLPGVTRDMQATRGRASLNGLRFGVTLHALWNDNTGELARSARGIAASMRRDEQAAAVAALRKGKIQYVDVKNPDQVTVKNVFEARNSITEVTLAEGMSKGRLAMRKLVNEVQKKPLGLTAKLLLVSPELEDEANRLTSPVYATNSSDVNANVDRQGRPLYTIIVVDEFDANEAYMFALPVDAPVLTFARPRQMTQPWVFSIPNVEQLGLEWGALDPFGVYFTQAEGAIKLNITGNRGRA
jgi:hypothetical protein